MSGRQGRQESSIDPTHGPQALFAQQLRDLRKTSGSPTYRELASWTRKIGTPYSDTTLSSAARGHELPSWDVTSAFVRACLSYAKTSGEQIEADVGTWASRWRHAKAELSPDGPSSSPGEESGERTEHAEPRQEGEGTGEVSGEAPGEVTTTARTGTPSTAPGTRTRLRPSGKKAGWALVGIAVVAAAVLVGRSMAAPESATTDAARSGATAAPGTSGAPASSTGAPGRLPSAPTADADLDGDYRCARPRLHDGVSWTPCTSVDAAELTFVVRLTNSGPDAVRVRTKLGYIRATVPHPCPGQWGTGAELTVKPGTSVMSPPGTCVVDKQPASAFQAVAWVGPPLRTAWDYREMSPTVHVQPDGQTTVWAGE
ncbi:hypothetical protein ACFWMU_36505 [Streptomyces sp. NPDC058357]|uniref:hypothetical protein n=1 Tax=unclassified Streptomyces TaxID=2593676 RepID=UPI00366343A2